MESVRTRFKAENAMQWFYAVLALICATGVFYLSKLFQDMAYWGEGLTWYWIGVVFTYLTGLLGIGFIILSVKRRNGKKTLFPILLRTFSTSALVIGFLWTTFVIIAGMSGM
ncbi:hypothetical protein ACE1TI_21460 [Alteribacillus sp. JSM 102045]|uniref:hypothetical protein n=1 Tax=Alteribacillus sp. JSM 102045 TaxID=1562101 RepID=UPI0035C1729C